MNLVLTPLSFAIVSIVFLTVGALVAQLTIQRLAGFKPSYLVTLLAGLMGSGAAYLLGILFSQVFLHLRMNITVPLVCLMIAAQLVTQGISYMLFTRKRDGRGLRFWQGCVVTICVFAVGAVVLLIWSGLRTI